MQILTQRTISDSLLVHLTSQSSQFSQFRFLSLHLLPELANTIRLAAAACSRIISHSYAIHTFLNLSNERNTLNNSTNLTNTWEQ